MQNNFSSLKVTSQTMHRVYFEIYNEKQWYAIIHEAQQLFGPNNWKGQSRVLRKLNRLALFPSTKTVLFPGKKTGHTTTHSSSTDSIRVWFDVPDVKFATWVAIKLAVRVVNPGYK